MVLAGIPGSPSTQTGFGALTYTTSPPTGLLGVGLGGDSTPRMIAFQLRLESWGRMPHIAVAIDLRPPRYSR